VDEGAYRSLKAAAIADAQARQAAAQATFTRYQPESEASRAKRVNDRLAEARAQAEAEAKNSPLRRISAGIREANARLDAHPPRPLSGGLDPAADEAVIQVQAGDLTRSKRNENLFRAAEIGAGAIGLSGAVIAAEGGIIALDSERELVVLESSRMEVRAKRLQQLHDRLEAMNKLAPEERTRAIRSALAEASPLLARARADTDMTGWRLIANANTRRENWEIEAPVLRKNIQTFARDKLKDFSAEKIANELPLLRQLSDFHHLVVTHSNARRFFIASAEEAGNDGVKRGLDWLDALVTGETK
jgi:hypothetical protein